MQERASKAWWSMRGPLRSCAPAWFAMSSVVATPMSCGQFRFLGTTGASASGSVATRCLVVDVEPADIGEGFAAALGGAAGVVVSGIVGFGQLDGLGDHRAGHRGEVAVGGVTATGGLRMKELVFPGRLLRVVGEQRLGVVGPTLHRLDRVLAVERNDDGQHVGLLRRVVLRGAFGHVAHHRADLTAGDGPGEPRRFGQRHRLQFPGHRHRRMRVTRRQTRRCVPRTAASTPPSTVDTGADRRRPPTAPS